MPSNNFWKFNRGINLTPQSVTPSSSSNGDMYYDTSSSKFKEYQNGNWINSDRDVISVKDFGATGDGTTNDTTAIQNAVTAAGSASGILLFPDGNYSSLTISVPANVYIKFAPGATFLKRTIIGANNDDNAFNVYGSTSTSSNLTSNVTLCSTSVVVTSNTGFAIGDWCLLQDLTYINTPGLAGQNQEIVRISNIAGTTITLTAPTIGSYATASTAALVKINPAINVTIDGAIIQVPTGATTGGGITLDLSINCRILNCVITGANNNPSVMFNRSYNGLIQGCACFNGQNLSNGGYAYAYAINESSHHMRVQNNHQENMRESTITNRARFVTFTNNTAKGGQDTHCNTHGSGCEHVLIDSNTCSGTNYGYAVGFSSGTGADKFVTVSNNVISDTRAQGISVAMPIGKECSDILVTGNTISNVGTSSASQAITVTNALKVDVTNNHINGTGNNSATYGVQFDTVVAGTITGNTINSLSNGYGVSIGDCTSIVIKDNYCANISSYNFRTTGTNTSCLIANNWADDALISIQSTGVVTLNNSWELDQVIVNVKSHGAVGDGVTDDTAAIQNAIAISTGKTLYFPKGTYIVSSQGGAWSGVTYALNVNVADVLFKGAGSESNIQLNVHSSATIIFLLNQASGTIQFRDLQISAPVASGHTYTGPVAVSVGEFGATAHSGNLSKLVVENTVCTNLAYWIHGEGCGQFYINNNQHTQAAGAAYPTSIQECINVASGTNITTSLICTNNIIIPDAVYGDHVLYTIGGIDQIIFQNNKIAQSANETLKVTNNSLAPHSQFINIFIEDNLLSGCVGTNGNTAIMFSGAAQCENLVVRANRCLDAGYGSFLYSEFQFKNASILENLCTAAISYAINFVKSGSLSLAGSVHIDNNNFSNYNTLQDGSTCILSQASLTSSINNNNLTEAGSGSGYTINPGSGFIYLSATNNISSTKSPSWDVLQNAASIHDLGNTWNQPIFYQTAVPTTGAHKKGEICFNSSPSSGSPIGWECTVNGSPGTWISLPNLGSTSDITLTSVGSTPNANGASLSGQQLQLQPANATNSGVVSTTIQTLAGNKTFTENMGIAGSYFSDAALNIGSNIVNGSAVTSYGVRAVPTFPSTATSANLAIYSQPFTAASTTVGSVANFYGDTIQVGSGGTVTRAYGARLVVPTAGTTGNAMLADSSPSGNYVIYSTNTNASLLSGALTLNNTLTVKGDGSNTGLSLNSSNALTIGASGGSQQHTANASTFAVNSPSGITALLAVQINGVAKSYFGASAATNSIITGSASGDTVISGIANMLLTAGGLTGQAAAVTIDSNKNVIIGSAALATSATDGFLYIESCAGTPSGIPTTKTGRVPMVYDSTNNKLYVYNGAWKSVTLA